MKINFNKILIVIFIVLFVVLGVELVFLFFYTNKRPASIKENPITTEKISLIPTNIVVSQNLDEVKKKNLEYDNWMEKFQFLSSSIITSKGFIQRIDTAVDNKNGIKITLSNKNKTKSYVFYYNDDNTETLKYFDQLNGQKKEIELDSLNLGDYIMIQETYQSLPDKPATKIKIEIAKISYE